MFKKSTLMLVLGCVASLALPGSARAEAFDFDPGMGADILNPNLAAGDGHPYDWYYQGIALNYWLSGESDGSDNNAPYIIFDGTDRSTAGHCLELVFSGPGAVTHSPYPVETMAVSFVDSAGTDRWIVQMNPDSGSYSTMRMWIQNTGSGLYWQLKLTDLDGAQGSWNQIAFMNVWRLDVSKAQCTSGLNPSIQAINISGVTGNSTACRVVGNSCVSL